MQSLIPMVIESTGRGERAYDIYLRSCGIKRMGKELKRIMNKALHNAIRQGHVVAEDELINTKGLIHAVVRTAGRPPLVLRERGPRTFEEIPPSELLAVSHVVCKDDSFRRGSDAHLHAILKVFDLKRLTTPTGTRLLEIIDLEFDYVTAWLGEQSMEEGGSQDGLRDPL